MVKVRELCIKQKIELGDADGSDLKDLEKQSDDKEVLGDGKEQEQEGDEQQEQGENGDIIYFELQTKNIVENTKGSLGYFRLKDK